VTAAALAAADGEPDVVVPEAPRAARKSTASRASVVPLTDVVR
jgi:hypothetical protein